MSTNFIPIGSFVLRTPLMPASKLLQLYSSYSAESLYEQFKDEKLLNAILISSSSLYQEIQKITDITQISERLQMSLLKYLIRAATRPTPFGLFGALTIGEISDLNTTLRIKSEISPKVRLDMDYLCNLHQELLSNASIRSRLKYFPNSCLYKTSKKLRYIEYHVSNGVRYHKLVTVDDNELLSRLLKITKSGLSYQDLVDIAENYASDNENAKNYVNQLIESQVLISSIFPTVSGVEYQDILFNFLLKSGINANEIQNVEHLLQSDKIAIDIRLSEIQTILKSSFRTTINEKRFIQVDSIRKDATAQINTKIINQLNEVIGVLDRILPYEYSETNLEKFKTAFFERYESAEVPLVHVLDSDLGLTYKVKNDRSQSLNKNKVTWDRYSKLLLDIYVKAEKNNLGSVDIEDYVVTNNYNSPANLPLPSAMTFMGKIYIEENKEIIYWNSLTGPNVLTLLGRFGHLSDGIKELCLKLVEHEESQYPDVIFAEIVHLSSGRLGNILTRPIYRDYEIPYLSNSQVNSKNQILVSDLMVSIRNGSLVLRSKKLNKIVVPRLSNAHNFTTSELPIYNFLCDLQYQKVRPSLGWQWSFLGGETFLPRITYKNVVLSAASWKLSHNDVKVLTSAKSNEVVNKFQTIRTRMKLPDLIIIKELDNHLLLNLNVPICIGLLISHLKENKTARLYESLCDVQNLAVKDENDSDYFNEVVIPLVAKSTKSAEQNKTKEFEYLKTVTKEAHSVRRDFSPFSDWLYLKIYTGKVISDKILYENVLKIQKSLIANKLITKWFFIRYRDPDNHLRIRFLVKDKKSVYKVFEILNKNLDNYITNEVIWKVQIDTYKRELERYGDRSIEACEEYFFVNSTLVLNLLEIIQKSKNSDVRFILALLTIHKLYNVAGYTYKQRKEIVKSGENTFLKEFGLENDKAFKDITNNEYRNQVKSIESALEKDTILDLSIELNSQIKIALDEHNKAFETIIDTLNKINDKPVLELISSFVHLFINRLFNSSQRFIELKVYFFLYKYYSSKEAKLRLNKVD